MAGDLGFVGAALPALARARAPARVCMADDPAAAEKKEDAKPAPMTPLKPLTPVAPPKSTASWANVWLPEFPRKGAGSVIGWDLRPSTLKGDGEGKGVCDLCSGSGEGVLCTMCNGHDFMGPDGTVVCNGCKGKHVMPCSTCYGSGKQLDIVGEWWKVDFTKFLRKGK